MSKKEIKNNNSEIKSVVGRKSKILKAVIGSLIVIFVLVGILIINNFIVKTNHDKKIENEKFRILSKAANDFFDENDFFEDKFKVLEEGILIDFSDDYYELYYDYEDDYEYENHYYNFILEEGILFKDLDGEISVISNIKIDGIYCIYENEKFDCNKKYNNKSNIDEIKNEGVYKIGDSVTMSDGSKWIVIKDSSRYSDYVTLISEGAYLNPNTNDYLWSFSPSGNLFYNKREEGSIAYYLDSEAKRLVKYENLYESRLLSVDEFDSLYSNYNYIYILQVEGIKNWMYYEYEYDDLYLLEEVLYSNEYDDGVYSYTDFEHYSVKTDYEYEGTLSDRLKGNNFSLRPVITIDKNSKDFNVQIDLLY